MRKSVILAACTLSLLLSACSSSYNEKEIRANALGYLQATGDYKLDEAIPYCTRITRERTIPTLQFLLDHTDTNYINSNRPSVFTLYSVRQLDDSTASVQYHKSTPIKEVDDSLVLRLEDGHWLADVRLGNIPYVNNIKAGRRPVSEIPRNLVPHPADSLTPEMLRPKLPQQ